jgi:hypothetical protein
MRVMFGIWGGVGLLGNIINFLELIMWGAVHHGEGIGVGTSAYMGTMALIWIGGMLFFGMWSIMRSEQRSGQQVQHARQMPPPLSPAGDVAMRM